MAGNSDQQEILYDSVEILSQTKSRAESRVRLLRSLHKDGEVDSQQLNRLRILYNEARAEVNGGLDRLIVELESTGEKESSEPYARVAERAARYAAQFLSESDTAIFGDDRGAIETGVKVADSLIGALVDVWKTIRGERVEQNRKLSQRIESFKWHNFDAIE